MKRIIICADDFGYNEAVSSGIIKLLHYGTINATSCMVNMPISKTHAQQLINTVTDNTDIGLHLNFTEGVGLSNGKPFQPLKSLLIKSHLNQLDYQHVYTEIMSQVKKFIQLFNKNPDFIDGHQHVHHLPTIRKALIHAYFDIKLDKSSTYIRSVANIAGRKSVKTHIIKSTGANNLLKLLKKFNIPTNNNFSGIYNFDHTVPFSKTMSDAYHKIQDKGIIMCHPGLNSIESDVLQNSRPKEFEYLLSEQCRSDQRENNIVLESGRKLFNTSKN